MRNNAISKKRVKKIALCSSANFYKEVLEIERELKKLGFKTAVPYTAYEMKRTGNFEVASYKTWLKDASAYKRKAFLMRHHFKKIVSSDSVLVVNFKKHDFDGYIGGNVLMEMAIAFHLKKPIFIFNEVSSALPYYEEILGMKPLFLNGDIKNLLRS